jgi:hypothetical protein
MTVLERPGDRVLVLLGSGGLAGTQAVINVLQQQAAAAPPHLWTVASMFDMANLVSDAMRAIERRDAPCLGEGGLKGKALATAGASTAIGATSSDPRCPAPRCGAPSRRMRPGGVGQLTIALGCPFEMLARQGTGE